MQPRSESVRLSFPIGFAREFGGEMRLPKSNMADAADAEDRDQFRALLF
jgi:hypothetical protein